MNGSLREADREDTDVRWRVGEFPGAALTKHHQPGGLTGQELSLRILEAQSLQSGCWQSWSPREAVGACSRPVPSCPQQPLALHGSPPLAVMRPRKDNSHPPRGLLQPSMTSS